MMKILNLGCGTKISSSPEIVNIDWSIYLRLKKNRAFRVLTPLLVEGERLRRFNSLSSNIMVHNLKKGIPFNSDSIDVVYHSHFLEHLDQGAVIVLLSEIKRVLKPGGVQRIVVPDLEKLCRSYLSHIKVCEKDPDETGKHDLYIAAIIEQSVRRESFGTKQQPALRRFMENLLFGDARRRGETHQWMYDRVNLSSLLINLGYRNPLLQQYNMSQIPNWNKYELDLDERNNEYKPDSLYLEVIK